MRKNNNHRAEQEKSRNSFLFNINDVLGTTPRVELAGNSTATIDGSRGVLEYSDSVIRVSMGSFSLKISGRALTLKCISATSLVVSGFIKSVEYIM